MDTALACGICVLSFNISLSVSSLYIEEAMYIYT